MKQMDDNNTIGVAGIRIDFTLQLLLYVVAVSMEKEEQDMVFGEIERIMSEKFQSPLVSNEIYAYAQTADRMRKYITKANKGCK